MLKPANENRFLGSIKCQTSTIISLGIKYFMRDLIRDVSYCASAS